MPNGTEGNGSRPPSLLLTFLGIHLRKPGRAVASGSVIDVLGRLGVSEQATRSAAARLTRRDLLHRIRQGRLSYLEPTDRLRTVLDDGHRRIWQSVVDPDWDGSWTLVGFSLPDSWGRQRHELRSRLTWAQFGLLQPGLWVAPGRVDVQAVIGGLGLDRNVTVTRGRAAPPTQAGDLVRRGFDLPTLAGRYQDFTARWDTPRPPAGDDPLARQLLLHAEWLGLIRHAPRLPTRLLPDDWPGLAAERVFQRLARAWQDPARQAAGRELRTIAAAPRRPVGPRRSGQAGELQHRVVPAPHAAQDGVHARVQQ